jgi:hypothetical protein
MFLAESGLRHHFLEQHFNDVPADHVAAVVSIGKRPMPDVFAALAAQQIASNEHSACPICNELGTDIAEVEPGTVWQFPATTYSEVKNHLAAH